MIKLAKGRMPDVLAENAAAWTAEYADALAAGAPISDTIRYRYRHRSIKSAVRSESFGKCIYCEKRDAPGEIDHLEPVVSRPTLIVTWTNLGFCCKPCNTNKGGYYAPAEPLINPFVDDPSQHLFVFGPLIRSQIGSQMGFRTVLVLELNRPELIERRKERIETIQSMLEHWAALPEGSTKDILKQKIIEEAGRDKEFTAVSRAFLNQAVGWNIDD